jgi:hypothetical protein
MTLRLHDFFDYNARVRPAHPCIVEGTRRWSYGEVARAAR